MATNLLHGKPEALKKFTDRVKRRAMLHAVEQYEEAS